MRTLYSFILYVHIFSVILSIGPFFLLLPMLKRLRKTELPVERAYLEIFRVAVRLTKHAGHVLVASGALLIALGPWSWKTPWIIITLLILTSSLFFLARAFSPTIRKFEDPQYEKKNLIDKLKRAVWIYLALLLLILWFMVSKPVLW